MKSFKSIRLSGINITIYFILICLSIVTLSKIWEATNKIIINPQEFNDLKLESPIIRPYDDVFFYLKTEALEEDSALYQKVQRNELILETIIGITFAVLFILVMLQLKSLLYSLKNKTFFLKKNLISVKKISYLLGIWVLADFIIYQCIQLFIPLSIVMENINYAPINKGFLSGFLLSVDFTILLAAFAFYVISVVFKEGYQLKEQSDLTI
ncbi:MAG: DUF2975 domain-containing protein [Bacteroidales bacterium]|nr:DUF2975 domain-containing protein [Bacteroidales bacterium]